MIRQIKIIIKELQNGENLDLYITIAISIVVAVLGVIGIVTFEILSAAILATLGLLANSLLASRRTISDVKSAASELDSEIKTLKQNFLNSDSPSLFLFRRDFPDFSKEFQSAARISILGASLHSTTMRYYSDYERALKSGASLRILVCEASPTLLKMQVFRTYTIRDAKLLGRTVQDHLSLIQKLKSSIPNCKCESRTIPLIISYGLVIIENPDGTAKAHVKLMPFRTPGPEYPAFEVQSRRNQEWFNFFNKQFEMLWSASNEVNSA